MESAFTARFKFIANRKKKSGNDCDRYLLIDYTPEEARKAAKWLSLKLMPVILLEDLPSGSIVLEQSMKKSLGLLSLAASGLLIHILRKNGLMAVAR